jgi:hypothetical protein
MLGYADAPTATHLTAEIQETDARSFMTVAGGLGEGCTVHVFPSQRCIRVVPGFGSPPTAVHALAELHDTPSSTFSPACASKGVGSTLQRVPFQPSASGAYVVD